MNPLIIILFKLIIRFVIITELYSYRIKTIFIHLGGPFILSTSIYQLTKSVLYLYSLIIY